MRKFEDLTEKQKDYICNGCGGKGGKVVPPYAIMFEADCNHHDFGYWKGGSIWDRFKADWKLAVAMTKDAFNFGWKLHRSAYFMGWTVGYFVGIRLAGFTFFNYTKTQRDPDMYDWDKIYKNEEPDNVIKWEKYEKTLN